MLVSPFYILALFCCCVGAVRLKVEQGWLEGQTLKLSTDDGHYYSFKGIPYAAPPIGKLRFKAPQPPTPWKGIRNASEHGSICIQFGLNTTIPSSEDCLFLNVYTPNLSPKTRLPVMVFFHGGGFQAGSGNSDIYAPDFLITLGVIVVTINYRLGALGFLSLETVEVPGNAGLKDQVAALKWVKSNIRCFGGDPDGVTIFGQSAGGASTGFHLISPMSTGLFNRAISMSGVPLCDWATSFEARRKAYAVGKELGFVTDDPNALLQYLQHIPAEKFVGINPPILISDDQTATALKTFYYTPVVEKNFGSNNFLTEDPIMAMKRGHVNKADIMIGHTDAESIIYFHDLEELVFERYSKYHEMVVPMKILNTVPPKDVLDIADRIHEYYFGKEPINIDIAKKLLAYFTDTNFAYDIKRFVRFLPKMGDRKKFLYKFSCYSDRNIYGVLGEKYGVTGASHMDDLMYIFDSKDAKSVELFSREYYMVQQACRLFTNFAKYGDPTPVTKRWPEYDNITQSYMDIGEVLTPGAAMNLEMMTFWRSIYEDSGLEF